MGTNCVRVILSGSSWYATSAGTSYSRRTIRTCAIAWVAARMSPTPRPPSQPPTTPPHPPSSPNARYAAFRTNIPGSNQLWPVPANGGWATQLTFTRESVRSASYSPVRHEIIFGMDTGGNERTQLYLLQGTPPSDHGLGD